MDLLLLIALVTALCWTMLPAQRRASDLDLTAELAPVDDDQPDAISSLR